MHIHICHTGRYSAYCANKKSTPKMHVIATSFLFPVLQNCADVSIKHNIDLTRLALKKSLEPSHVVLQLLMKNLYSVLILHLLKPLFSAFHVLQPLGIFCFS